MKGTFSIREEIEVDYREFIVNLLSDGLYYFSGYGFSLNYDRGAYKVAKSKLTKPCIEDVQAQMLIDGGSLTFIDEKCDGEYTKELTLSSIEKALWKFLDEQPDDNFILTFERMQNGDYDAEDCDFILQHILFGECVFG